MFIILIHFTPACVNKWFVFISQRDYLLFRLFRGIDYHEEREIPVYRIFLSPSVPLRATFRLVFSDTRRRWGLWLAERLIAVINLSRIRINVTVTRSSIRRLAWHQTTTNATKWLWWPWRRRMNISTANNAFHPCYNLSVWCVINWRGCSVVCKEGKTSHLNRILLSSGYFFCLGLLLLRWKFLHQLIARRFGNLTAWHFVCSDSLGEGREQHQDRHRRRADRHESGRGVAGGLGEDVLRMFG